MKMHGVVGSALACLFMGACNDRIVAFDASADLFVLHSISGVEPGEASQVHCPDVLNGELRFAPGVASRSGSVELRHTLRTRSPVGEEITTQVDTASFSTEGDSIRLVLNGSTIAMVAWEEPGRTLVIRDAGCFAGQRGGIRDLPYRVLYVRAGVQ